MSAVCLVGSGCDYFQFQIENPSLGFCQTGSSIKISQDVQVFGENWFEYFLA